MILDYKPIKYRHGEVWIVYISLNSVIYCKLYIIRLATERNNYVFGFVNSLFNCEYFLIHFDVYDAYVSCNLFLFFLSIRNNPKYAYCLTLTTCYIDEAMSI